MFAQAIMLGIIRDILVSKLCQHAFESRAKIVESRNIALLVLHDIICMNF